MSIIRDCVKKMTAYIPGEDAGDPEVTKLNQNENRYPPSPAVLEAVRGALDTLALYPESTSKGVRRAAAELYGVRPEEVMAGNGSDEVLRLAFQVSCDPGAEVVAFNPSYTYYETLAAMHDVRYRLIDFEGEFAIPARLELAGAKLVILPNPNAPTGTVFPEKEIRRLVEAAADSLVIIDEAYADYCGQTAIPLIHEYDNLLVARTFSKSYALAGLRLGLGFACRKLLDEMEKIRDFYNLDHLAQAGAEAALLDRQWLADNAAKIIATRERTRQDVMRLGLKVYESGANFILIRFADAATAKNAFEGLRSRKVLTRYFSRPGIDDCLRVSIGTDADMDVFLARLREVLQS